MGDSVDYTQNIRSSGMTIYDSIEIGDLEYWIPSGPLEEALNSSLIGVSLSGMPLRTRSKFVKELVCDALGYPRPPSFKKTNPRFPGQNFDTYVQKSNNLQVWNEELDSIRRYVMVRVSDDDSITKVKVVTGDILARLDTTGTLTQKYQARLIPSEEITELISGSDTEIVIPLLTSTDVDLSELSPIAIPESFQLLPVAELFRRLEPLVGQSFEDIGADQERNRGAILHNMVCECLGYTHYYDDGQFPDIKNQLLEVKLQTSPTVDLGLVTPSSTDPLDLPKIGGMTIRHCDVRYALVYGELTDGIIRITNLYVTTGLHFFSRFPQFGGKVLNKKIQIPLPKSFFD